MRHTLVVGPPERLRAALAEAFAGEAAAALAARGRVTLALSGGSVATALLPALRAAAVDWGRVEVFWLDERAVPPTDPQSNYRAAREALLDHVPVDPARVHRLRGDAADLDAAALAAERELRQVLGPRGHLDLAIAGVGPDGHVASLFPGHRALGESARWAVAVDDAPKPPPRRLTLTLRAFAATGLLVVGALGGEKAAPMRALLGDERCGLPIALAARRARRRLVLLDPAAAALVDR